MKLSVVICIYNEELNIKPLNQQLSNALEGIDHEIIMVDDGSTDNSPKEIKNQMLLNDRIRLVELRKNYGQSSALAAGIEYAGAEYIVLMDGDLQNDPADIPDMLKLAETDLWDVISGKRAKRKDNAMFRKIPSKVANWLIRRTTGLKIEDYGCTLRLFKSEIAKNLSLYGELHRFIPILAHLQGAKLHQVDVQHHPRIHGKSNYSLTRTYKVISDLIFILFLNKYLPRPMHLFGGVGLLMMFIGIILNSYLLLLKILGHDIWGKPLLILGVITLIGGIQFITFGIIAEIQIRTYFESQGKKHYSVRKIHQYSEKTENIAIA